MSKFVFSSKNHNDLIWVNKALYGIKKYIVILTFVRAALGIMGIGYAAALKKIVDEALAGNRHNMMHIIVMFAMLILSQFILLNISRILAEYVKASVENRLKQRLFENILYKDYSKVTSYHSGDWMNRITSDTVVVSNAVTEIIPNAAGLIVRFISSFGMLFFLVPTFAFILLIVGIIITFSTLWLRKLMKNMHRHIQECDGNLRVYLTERIVSLMMVKVYQQEGKACSDATEFMKKHKAARMKKSFISNICNSGFLLVMNGGIALGAAYCGLGILNGTISYGTFTAVVQLIGQLHSPMAGITGFIPQYYAMLASAERLMEIEEYKNSINKNDQPDFEFESFGLDNVSFRYSDDDNNKDIISNMSFDIKNGEYVAFTGPSGCGKSTVLKLLLGLYKQDKGDIYVNTSKGREKLSNEWCSMFAYVPQGNQLMRGTIREVVSFSRPGEINNTEGILKALEISCAREFVDKLPAGIDTELGERGAGLSEGQMQRIAVARALFSDRPVLIFDESTSSLDSKLEIELLDNIRSLTHKTVICVTHRTTALNIVDKKIEFHSNI